MRGSQGTAHRGPVVCGGGPLLVCRDSGDRQYLERWRALSCPRPPRRLPYGVGGLGGAERQGFLLCPATEKLPRGYGDRTAQFYDSVDSSCQGRPVRPLAPSSFRVEICDAGWTLGFLPLWDTRKEEAWEGTAGGWAGLFRG